VYCETLSICIGLFRTKGMECWHGVVLFHDNARLHTHTAAHTRALLEHFSWDLFDHPLYSPDLAPSDYHLFTYPKNWLGSQCFKSNEELMEVVKMWLSSQAANVFNMGIQNIFPNMASASVLAVTKFRSSLKMYIFFCI
jgi:transposase